MEVKKIAKGCLISIFGTFTLIVTLIMGSLYDITEYKQIGDTNFSLYHDWQGRGSYLRYAIGDGSYSIDHEGIVKEVLWNDNYVVIKCSIKEDGPIERWYIYNNIKNEYCPKLFNKKQFLNKKAYLSALKLLGLSENEMEQTDGSIPWYPYGVLLGLVPWIIFIFLYKKIKKWK